MQVPQAVASGLTVRVINNITKKLDVKQRFLETFKNDGFPTQFQYKQKVGLALFSNESIKRVFNKRTFIEIGPTSEGSARIRRAFACRTINCVSQLGSVDPVVSAALSLMSSGILYQ